MKLLFAFALVCLSFPGLAGEGSSVFVEAESFADKGGWVVDQQFSEMMGSSYLMAHGMGIPVKDAVSSLTFPETGEYRIFVRTYNWTSPWHAGVGPGKFQLLVDGIPTCEFLGASGSGWYWQDAGKVTIRKKNALVALHDLTGFNGRCDALYFTTGSNPPPEELSLLSEFRKKRLGLPKKPVNEGKYDLVVIGGGVAGTCAAISAARLGLRVALVQDRPVLGGNNSSEVRVHLGGRINLEPFPALGEVVKEIGPSKGGNAQPASFYEDDKKMKMLLDEPNIRLFLNYKAFGVKKKGSVIKEVIARHTENSGEISLSAPLFADCTGDGTIGVLAGADYTMGREGKNDYNEPNAPEKSDKLTMGASVQWYSVECDKENSFPEFSYGLLFNEKNVQKVKKGEWTWETGMNLDQVKDFERIRDYGLLVVYSNWATLKNHSSFKEDYRNDCLGWVAFIAGKRESRRLLGDIILKEQDISDHVLYPDASLTTSWSIDLHYPDPKNTEYFPGKEFKSIAEQKSIHLYPIPYRCLYSRNVDNLFMAGRNISVTHIVLGTTRVMRTTGMMGEVVGMAASIAAGNKTSPRGVYRDHLEELKALMEKGVGKHHAEDHQKYNLGGTLGPRKNPVKKL